MSRTITRRTRLAAALVLIAAGFALIAQVLLPAPAQALDSPSKGDRIFARMVVGPATELTPQQVATIAQAGDQVCEGITAGVTLPTMAATVAATHGVTPAEAGRLVSVAASYRC